MKQRLSSLVTPQDIAAMGAQRSGMANAAASVGAGQPNAAREAMARSIAARGAQASGMGDAASMVGAAPSRGEIIRGRLSELRASGVSQREAIMQLAQEGLVSPKFLDAMTAVPDAVPKY